MKNEKSRDEELENKISQLQKEIFELKSKQNISVESLDLMPSILDKILDISPIGISYIDASGKVVYSNKRAKEIFLLPKIKQLENEATTAAWQATTLDGKPFPDEELPFAQVKNTKKPVFEIEHAIEYEGQKKIISVSAVPVLTNTNDFLGMVAVVEDITDRKNAVKEIKKSEEKYRLLFAENPQPMWIYDLETLAFLEVNQAAISHYGYTLEEFLSMTLKDIRPVEDIPALMEDVKNTKSSLNSAGEWRHIKKNGEIIVVEITSHSVMSKNRNARHVLINDITERKQTHLEYQTMIKTSRDGFWIVDARTGKFLDVNQSYCEMIGYSREELLQMAIPDIEAIETSEETKKHIEKIKELGFDSFETKHKTKSGKIIDIYASVTFIGLSVNKFFVFIKDISERKRAESEILKLSQAVEQSPVSVIITNLMGDIEYVNSKFVELTGYSSNEVASKNPHLLKSGELPKEEYKKLWDTILSGKTWRGEFHNKKKNGELYWEFASISPIVDKAGKITHFIAVKEDITERKRVEKNLIRSETELKRAQQITQIGSWYLDIETNEVKWTEELYKMYDFDPSLPPPPYTEHKKLFTPESWELLSCSLATAIETGIPYEIELKTIRKDGSNGWIWMRGETEKDKQGKTIGLWGVAQNITQRKMNEEELIKSKEKAQESDRLKSAFLANMSHEIRTPMNGILGFAGLLKESDLSGEQQQKYIKVIEKSGERMLNIINDIVSLSKIESGIMHIHLSEMNVNNQLEFVYNSMKLDADGKNLTLSYTNALPDNDAVINTDSEKFYSILSNLIKNAIKYTQKGKIEFGYYIKTNNEGTVLEFFVKDTGIGIPKDRQEIIFERFIQADTEDKMAKQGAGLGLSISRSYVEMLKGKIWVESEPDCGSTFYFTIPFISITKEKPVQNNLGSAWEDKTHLEIFKILIVDDDETSEVLMKEMVSKLCKEVLTARNGLDAVNLCRQNSDIDLILMDIQMPELNGYKATQQIRQFNKDVIIIAQTAFALSGDNKKAINAGCNDYISKPIILEKLTGIIFKHLKNKGITGSNK